MGLPVGLRPLAGHRDDSTILLCLTGVILGQCCFAVSGGVQTLQSEVILVGKRNYNQGKILLLQHQHKRAKLHALRKVTPAEASEPVGSLARDAQGSKFCCGSQLLGGRSCGLPSDPFESSCRSGVART